MSILLAFIIALSGLSMPSLNASLEAPATTHEALLEAPIKAPAEALLVPAEVEVTTTPAPAVEAPSQAPDVAPRCEEDMPCWDCTTMGNKVCGPQTSPQAPAQVCEEDMPCWDCTTMGNKVCGPVQPAKASALTADGVNPECAEQSMQTAADGSCLTETECAVAGDVLDGGGNCGPRKDND